jgi:hypothetical protein
MTVSAHKIGGPVGVGRPLARRDASARAHRPRWWPGAAGAQRHPQRGRHRLVRRGPGGDGRPPRPSRPSASLALRDRFIEGRSDGPRASSVSGCWKAGDATKRLPGNAHLSCPGARATRCSTSSTPPGSSAPPGRPARPGCRSPATSCSPWGVTEEQARGALRLSLGHTSTEADVDACWPPCPGASSRARRGERADPDARRRRDVAAGSTRPSPPPGCSTPGTRSSASTWPSRARRDAARVRPWVLHHRGCRDARRVADRLGIPFYVWDLAEPLRARRRRGLRRRVPARAHAEPVPALQRADQVRGAARQGPGPGVRRRRDGHYAQIVDGPDGPRAAPGGRRREGPVVRARGAGRRPARRTLVLPAR